MPIDTSEEIDVFSLYIKDYNCIWNGLNGKRSSISEMLSFSIILTPQDVLMTIYDLSNPRSKWVLYWQCKGCGRKWDKIQVKEGGFVRGSSKLEKISY